MKKMIWFALTLSLVLCLAACSQSGQTATNPDEDLLETTQPEPTGKLVVLYTADVHNAYAADGKGSLGYAAVAAYRTALEKEGNAVVLIDGGDALQGSVMGTLSDGGYIAQMMNAAGYSIAVPGVHEFDFGVDVLLELAEEKAEYRYICCNFVDLRTGDTVFDPYVIVEANGVKVAFVGITTPRAADADRFLTPSGALAYGFCDGGDGQALYDAVQKAIDDARGEGAEYVIAVGHLGTDPADAPWSSADVIANTTGLTAFLDAKSHAVLEGATQEDMDLNEVLLCAAGEELQYLAQLTLELDTGASSAQLLRELEKQDDDVLDAIAELENELQARLEEPIAVAETDLIALDPDDPTVRLTCSQQTNLGDLCADAYRTVLGTDIAFVTGGSIFADIPAGRVNWANIMDVYPFSRSACVVRVTGQQILNALEFSCRSLPEEENSGLLHVSGLTFEVDTSVSGGVQVNEDGEFMGVAGTVRRVRNVRVGDVPLDPKAYYTLAANDYLLLYGGEGYTMLKGSEVLRRDVMPDHLVLYTYICDHLDNLISEDIYGDPDGSGRITVK